MDEPLPGSHEAEMASLDRGLLWPHNLRWQCIEHDVPASRAHLAKFDYECHVKLKAKR